MKLFAWIPKLLRALWAKPSVSPKAVEVTNVKYGQKVS